MRRDDEFIGQLEAYLDEYEGRTPLPDAVRNAVRAQLPSAKQLGRFGGLTRMSPVMSNTIPGFAMATAAIMAVVLAGFLGYRFLSGPNVGGPGSTAAPTPSPIPTGTPSPTPEAADFPPQGPLAIGRHSMTLVGTPLSIDFPANGWVSNGAWGIEKGTVGAPGAAAFIFWPASAPDNVFADPCAGTLLSPPPGPSASELAAAVAAVPGINLVSGPSEVTIGGHPAQHVVFTVPDTIGCPATSFDLWEDLDTSGEYRWATQAGETFYVWIIDVDGAIVWIDGETYADSGPAAAQEVKDIVDSIVFE